MSGFSEISVGRYIVKPYRASLLLCNSSLNEKLIKGAADANFCHWFCVLVGACLLIKNS